MALHFCSKKYTVYIVRLQSLDMISNISTSPLYFVRSGYIRLSIIEGTFRSAGYSSGYWLSEASNGSMSYHAFFNTTNINTSAGPDYRWFGFPLR